MVPAPLDGRTLGYCSWLMMAGSRTPWVVVHLSSCQTPGKSTKTLHKKAGFLCKMLTWHLLDRCKQAWNPSAHDATLTSPHHPVLFFQLPALFVLLVPAACTSCTTTTTARLDDASSPPHQSSLSLLWRSQKVRHYSLCVFWFCE